MIDYNALQEMKGMSEKGLENVISDNFTNFSMRIFTITPTIYLLRKILKSPYNISNETKIILSAAVTLMSVVTGNEAYIGNFAGFYLGMNLGEYLSERF